MPSRTTSLPRRVAWPTSWTKCRWPWTVAPSADHTRHGLLSFLYKHTRPAPPPPSNGGGGQCAIVIWIVPCRWLKRQNPLPSPSYEVGYSTPAGLGSGTPVLDHKTLLWSSQPQTFLPLPPHKVLVSQTLVIVLSYFALSSMQNWIGNLADVLYVCVYD